MRIARIFKCGFWLRKAVSPRRDGCSFLGDALDENRSAAPVGPRMCVCSNPHLKMRASFDRRSAAGECDQNFAPGLPAFGSRGTDEDSPHFQMRVLVAEGGFVPAGRPKRLFWARYWAKTVRPAGLVCKCRSALLTQIVESFGVTSRHSTFAFRFVGQGSWACRSYRPGEFLAGLFLGLQPRLSQDGLSALSGQVGQVGMCRASLGPHY